MNAKANPSFRQSKIQHPELFFGIVSAVGTDVPAVISSFSKGLRDKGYSPHHVKITDLFPTLAKNIKSVTLNEQGRINRIQSYIEFGNFLRKRLGNDILSVLAMGEVARIRNNHKKTGKARAYIIDQIKSEDELELLREVYGVNFFQVSIYSARDVRVDNLSKFAAHDRRSGDKNSFRNEAEELVTRDEGEKERYGQKVGKIFQAADVVFNVDRVEPGRDVSTQVNRFLEVLFGSNRHSPTRMEYGMYLAYSAALRSLDLSRQVGAAIFRSTGEIAALGTNEVPKAGGGTYWTDAEYDAREHTRGNDSNDVRKTELLNEILEIALGENYKISDVNEERLRESQFMDALEYGRIVHAEMCALTDAARLGISLEGGTLYCTTFPCHMCSKHVVASGISTVVFLEPYPKSLTADLHSDSIKIQGTARGTYDSFPSVSFVHFFGITPRRYRELFARGKRKEAGKFMQYQTDEPAPVISTVLPGYLNREADLFKLGINKFAGLAKEEAVQLA
jgi:deoxycytidylate deaminase